MHKSILCKTQLSTRRLFPCSNPHFMCFDWNWRNDFPASVIGFESQVMHGDASVRPCHGNSGAPEKEKKRGTPEALPAHSAAAPPPLPTACGFMPQASQPLAARDGWGVRATDAAGLHSISLIRTGTTNKTGWCAGKKKQWDVPLQEAIISPTCAWHANYG